MIAGSAATRYLEKSRPLEGRRRRHQAIAAHSLRGIAARGLDHTQRQASRIGRDVDQAAAVTASPGTPAQIIFAVRQRIEDVPKRLGCQDLQIRIAVLKCFGAYENLRPRCAQFCQYIVAFVGCRAHDRSSLPRNTSASMAPATRFISPCVRS